MRETVLSCCVAASAPVLYELLHGETINIVCRSLNVRVVENSTDIAVLRDRESKKAAGRNPMTGLVVDSGDGVTHIIPVTALALH